MSNKRHATGSVQVNNQNKDSKVDASEINKIVLFIISIAVSFGGSFMGYLLYDISSQIGAMNAQINNINIQISEIKGDIKNLQEDIEEIDKRVVALEIRQETYGIIQDHIVDDEEEGEAAISIQPDGLFAEAIKMESFTVTQDQFMSAPTWETTSIIAIGTNGEKYTAKQLENHPVVMSYIENSQEIFFCGQFNEKNHWDGDCLINVYKDEALVFATETLYEDGTALEAETFYPDGDVWRCLKKRYINDESDGDVWCYAKVVEFPQIVKFDTPDERMMITPSTFMHNIQTELIQRYHGKIVDGKYNDQTGNAWLVSNYKDGITRRLYCGCFKDGENEDQTGNAWDVSFDKEKDTKYMYYKGTYRSGKASHETDDEQFLNPVSWNFIAGLTEGQPYEEYLNWDYDRFTTD